MKTANDHFTIEARQTVINEAERARRLAICYGILFDEPLFGETAVKAVTAEASETDEAETKNAPE
jgi:hypothetical protein